jgi:23S rRNA (adenine2503-C2)-methyltransferase
MLDQVRWVLDRHPEDPGRCAKLKVHFARMGEPALNDAVLDAVAALPEATGAPGLWCCVPTVAPRGRNRWFDRLIDEKEARHRGRFQLQFSVQSTRASDRARLIPIPHWSLDEIAAYGVRFVRPGDRKAVLNFALAEDVAFDPAAIRDRFDPAAFAVKITPVNPTARGAASRFRTVLRSDAEARVRGAAEDLVSRGFDVVWSVGDPREDRVGSNCGQAVRVFRFGERPGERPATSAPA